MAWYPYADGNTVGTPGSEIGVIVLDEEHPDGARITLERDGYHPYSITCGIYGALMHTAFAMSETEGRSKYESMKTRLVLLMSEADSGAFDTCLQEFVREF
jgi:hypothetical protein